MQCCANTYGLNRQAAGSRHQKNPIQITDGNRESYLKSHNETNKAGRYGKEDEGFLLCVWLWTYVIGLQQLLYYVLTGNVLGIMNEYLLTYSASKYWYII